MSLQKSFVLLLLLLPPFVIVYSWNCTSKVVCWWFLEHQSRIYSKETPTRRNHRQRESGRERDKEWCTSASIFHKFINLQKLVTKDLSRWMGNYVDMLLPCWLGRSLWLEQISNYGTFWPRRLFHTTICNTFPNCNGIRSTGWRFTYLIGTRQVKQPLG